MPLERRREAIELVRHAELFDVLVFERLDERARAAALDDEPLLDELVDGALDRNAADIILLAHFFFERELLAWRIDTVHDILTKFICYRFVF